MIIAIEGLDGVGKSTQTQKLVDEIEFCNVATAYYMPDAYLSETIDTASPLVEDFLNGGFRNLNPKAVASAFALERWGYFHDAGFVSDHKFDSPSEIFVFDRYVGSNKAYQSARVGLKERDYIRSWIDNYEHVDLGIPRADLTIYLHADFNVIVESLKNREQSGKDLDDNERNLKYLKDVYFEYLHIAREEGWEIIDCSPNAKMNPIEVVSSDIWWVVSEFLKREGVTT